MARYNAGIIPPSPSVVSGITAFGTHVNPLINAVMSGNSGTTKPDAGAPGLIYSKEIAGGYQPTLLASPTIEVAMGQIVTAEGRWKLPIDVIEEGLVASGRGVATGAGFMWFGATAPVGTVFCDGSAYSRTTYAALFAVIGTSYGVGNGSTTFNVPDFRNRSPLGSGTRGLGTVGGTEVHNLTVAELPPHTHGPGTLNGATSSDGAHLHGVTASNIGSSGTVVGLTAGGNSIGTFNTGSAGAHTHTVTINGGETGGAGGGDGHNNMHPFLTCHFVIKH